MEESPKQELEIVEDIQEAEVVKVEHETRVEEISQGIMNQELETKIR